MTIPPKHSSNTSPDATTSTSGPRSTVFCSPQEAVPVCSGQCAFPKRPSDSAIEWSTCDTSNPSDTPRSFIQSRFLLFYGRSRGDLQLWQEVHGHPEGGSRRIPLWERACPSSTRYPEFNQPTICPRGPYWGWRSQRLKSDIRPYPFQESGSEGWWWHGTSPREFYFGIHYCYWHAVWKIDMGVGWYRSPCCGSTKL